ncbi:hypothetical protein KAR91_20470 [Candidatus Pacearchaeota archaeon]|nr:hypothetical protein [Candidatus Pacearchaeota archaeon]
MGLIGALFGGGAKGAGEGVGAVLGGVGGLAKDLRSAFTGEMPNEMIIKLNEIDAAIAKGQADINMIDAQSGNMFQAGWRPAIGWTCAIGVFYHFIGYPFILWVIAVLGIEVVAPTLNTQGLMSLVMGMLGMGAMRSWEKHKGVQGKH